MRRLTLANLLSPKTAREGLDSRAVLYHSYMMHLTLVLSSYRTSRSLARSFTLYKRLFTVTACDHVVDTRPVRVFLLLALKLPSHWQNLS